MILAPTITPAKALRSQQIAQCVELVSAHFNVDPRSVLTAFARKSMGITASRNLLWHHLHACGMSFNALSRIWKLSADHITRSARDGRIRMLPEEAALLKTLPRLDTTLDIQRKATQP